MTDSVRNFYDAVLQQKKVLTICCALHFLTKKMCVHIICSSFYSCLPWKKAASGQPGNPAPAVSPVRVMQEVDYDQGLTFLVHDSCCQSYRGDAGSGLRRGLKYHAGDSCF